MLGLGLDTGDAVPSVLLFFDHQRYSSPGICFVCSSPLEPQIVCLDVIPNVTLCRYIFNAGEGFQRFCVQHKLKLNRMPNILVTRASLDAVGGIPGNACKSDQLFFNASEFQLGSDLPTDVYDRHGFDDGRLFNFTSS